MSIVYKLWTWFNSFQIASVNPLKFLADAYVLGLFPMVRGKRRYSDDCGYRGVLWVFALNFAEFPRRAHGHVRA